MPVNSTGRKYLTDLVKGVDSFSEDSAVRFSYETVAVGGTGEVDNIGIPLVWVNANSRFEVYVAQDISAVTGSPLPEGFPIAISVGDKFGVGRNRADTNLATSGQQMTVLYAGPAAITNEGIVWGSATSGDQDEFRDQLEKQRMRIVANATTVTPAYTS